MLRSVKLACRNRMWQKWFPQGKAHRNRGCHWSHWILSKTHRNINAINLNAKNVLKLKTKFKNVEAMTVLRKLTTELNWLKGVWVGKFSQRKRTSLGILTFTVFTNGWLSTYSGSTGVFRSRMVWKCNAVSRNRTSNLEFWSFPGLAVGGTIFPKVLPSKPWAQYALSNELQDTSEHYIQHLLSNRLCIRWFCPTIGQPKSSEHV